MVGEVAGLGLGLAEDLSAICLHGNAQDGYMDPEPAGGYTGKVRTYKHLHLMWKLSISKTTWLN